MGTPLSNRLLRLASEMARVVRVGALIAASKPHRSKGYCEVYRLCNSRSLFGSKIVEHLKFGAHFEPITKPNELVRMDFNLDNFESGAALFRDLVIMEVTPFVIGVGELLAEKTPEGFIILLKENSAIKDRHSNPPYLRIAEIIETIVNDDSAMDRMAARLFDFYCHELTGVPLSTLASAKSLIEDVLRAAIVQ